MPSTNGVYTLPVGYLAVTGATIQASQHNPPLEDIAAALTLRLSRDGTAAMTGALQFASGSVSAPGAVFSADATSGFYKTTSGIGVAIGGTKVGEFLPGGFVGARFIGELIAYTGTVAPALTVLPYGQTLSRTTYAALWAVAQTEIAAGNTFYNNGDGSTTFGIGDLRSRIPVPWDKMGGSAAGRLTTANSGIDGTTLGTAGGNPNYKLLQTDLPNIAPTFTGQSSTVSGTTAANVVTATGDFGGVSGGAGGGIALTGVTLNGSGVSISGSTTAKGTVSSLNGGVSQTTMLTMPPVMVCNYLLFAGA